MAQPLEVRENSAARPSLPLLPVRIVQVITAPGALFSRLKDRPVWLDALVTLIALGVATTYLIPDEVQRQLIEQFLPAGTDPQQIDQIIESSRTQGLIGTILATPILISIIAGLLLLAYNVVLGGEATFRQLFSATTHAMFVLTLGGFIVIGLMAMGSKEAILSPALLLPDLGDGFLARLLSRINVFAIWMCVTLGVAVSRIYPKRSIAGATFYLVVLYLIQASLTAAFAGLALSAAG